MVSHVCDTGNVDDLSPSLTVTDINVAYFFRKKMIWKPKNQKR